MNHYLRNILALMAVVWLAIPAPGNGGGENNGGSGVWILPACANITVQDPNALPRASHSFANTASDIKLKVSSSMGTATATFTDDLSGTTVGMQVAGRVVTIPKQLLQALAQSPVRKGTLLISDAAQNGYVIRVIVRANGSVKIAVF